MSNAYDNASLLVTPNGYEAGTIFSAKPTNGSGDLTFSRASTALRRNSAGLWESVANNVPRLNYPVGGGCPSWLFEAEATNLLTLSNTFTVGTWSAFGITLLGGQTDSPAVGSTSTLLYPTATANDKRIQATFTAVNGQAYTTSIRVKPSGKSWIAFTDVNLGQIVWMNVSTGALGTVGAGITASITLDSEGYYLCSFTSTATSTLGRFYMLIVDGNGTLDITANGTDGVLIWNSQVETGSVATSPIITAGSAVTRVADVSDTTGLSAVIGQTEGTLFLDANFDSWTIGSIILGLYGGGNEIYFRNNAAGQISFVHFFGSTQAAITVTGLSLGRIKMAARYQNNNWAFYVNGVQIGVDTSGTFSGTISILGNGYAGGDYPFVEVNQIILYKAALTNAELEELTTL